MAVLSTASTYITLSTRTGIPAPSSAMSISAWFKWTTPSPYSYSFLNIVSLGSERSVQMGANGGQARIWRWGAFALITDPGTLSAGVWYNYVYTYDGAGNHLLYLNGGSPTSGTFTQLSGATDSVQLFGNQWLEHSSGTGEDFRIYNRVLTANEALTLYSIPGEDGIVDGLVGRWLFNEGAPSVAVSDANLFIDLSPSENAMTGAASPSGFSYAESIVNYKRKYIQ